MKVALNLSDAVDLGNNGIVLEVRDGSGKHLGNLRIGRATVSWTKTRARSKQDGIKFDDLIKFVDESQKAGKPAPRRPRKVAGPTAKKAGSRAPRKP